MSKEMEIKFERGGRFVATLLEEAAPETSKAVWKALPIEGRMNHAMFSGQVIFCLTDFALKVVENPRRIAQPGDLLFNTHIVPIGPANKPIPCEIAFVYGTQAMLTDLPGIPSAANYFARVTEGDLKELLEVGKRIKSKGVETVSIQRKE